MTYKDRTKTGKIVIVALNLPNSSRRVHTKPPGKEVTIPKFNILACVYSRAFYYKNRFTCKKRNNTHSCDKPFLCLGVKR